MADAHVIIETSEHFTIKEVQRIVDRIAGRMYLDLQVVKQDKHQSAKAMQCKEDTKKNEYPKAIVNPLGEWTGGTNVDSGATNRKLGSDMAQSVTGGGLHGKDLSKADVSVNIYAFLKAQETQKVVELSCAIGDEYIDGRPYTEIVEEARKYINKLVALKSLLNGDYSKR